MKLKINIAKLLAAGLLLNNIYFYSNANTLNNEIPGRYQTLEGEYITIDDSVEGNLEEIEVFGNTIQDSTNLNDIQSVGDLYVDKNGNPILDKQGREQYKVEIISKEDRTLKTYDYFINTVAYFLQKDSNSTSFYIDNIRAGIEYNFNVKTSKGNRFHIATYNSLEHGENAVEVLHASSAPILSVTPSLDAKYLVLYINNTKNENIEVEISSELTQIHKSTIILPCQLQKVGKVADRLYWDSNLGRYVIEKNIVRYHIDELTILKTPYIGSITSTMNLLYKSDIGAPNTKSGHGVSLCSSLKEVGYYHYDVRMDIDERKYSFNNDAGGDWLGIVLPAEFDTNTAFIEELKRLNTFFLFQLKNAELIETNITSKIKVPTYEGKTYIFAETKNGINPNLKVTVDRLMQVAKKAVVQAESDSTNYNISLARMYVNMLPESLYKDQLQEQLSEVFSSDITLYRKAASSNLDVYVKSQNMLSMSLNTNSITFDGYSGVEDMEMLSVVNISINSSLPYRLNAYMPNEIANSDKSNIVDIDILNIRESSETDYKQFANTTDKIVLKDSCVKGNNNSHNIDLKLASNQAHKADVYKAVIKFEAEQK